MTQQETIESKLDRMIDTFRNEFEKLSPEEKKKEQMINSLKGPCQIHLISSPYNNIHLMFVTHLESLDDKKIVLINLKPDSFIKKLEEFASNPIWDIDNDEIKEFTALTFKQSVESAVISFGKRIQKNISFSPERASIGGQGLYNPKLAIWDLAGNLIEIDFDKYAIGNVQGYKADYVRDKNVKTEQVRESIPDQNVGLGTFFYPALLIGEFNPTMEERIQEKEYDLLEKNVIMTNFNGVGLVVTKGGMIGMENKNLELAEKNFNTIMATALLFRIPLQALRSSEIANVTFDIKTHKIISSSWSGNSKRNEMFSHRSFRESFYSDYRNQIAVKDMELIIKKAESFLKNEEQVYLLKLLLSSYTQMSNSDFSQSFVTSWTIIEKNLYDMWMKKLVLARVSKRIREDLDRWDLYRILEVLHLDQIIPDDEYYELRTLQSLRNEVIHEGHDVSNKMAEKCYVLAEQIVRKITVLENVIKIKQISI